jgi:hypothetical protein
MAQQHFIQVELNIRALITAIQLVQPSGTQQPENISFPVPPFLLGASSLPLLL